MEDNIEDHTTESRMSNFPVKSTSTYASTPFKFIVQGATFFLHASLVSKSSNPLDRMINGVMSEAQQAYALLEEAEESTFARFAEWIYQGYYTPAAVICQKPDLPNSKTNTFENTGSRKSKEPWDSTSFTQAQLRSSFITGKPLTQRDTISIPTTRPNRERGDYTKLYVFADKFDIQSLKTLALHNLHNVLANFTLYEERTRDFITLLRYVHLNTNESVDGDEEMRALLRHYVGFEMDNLLKDENFHDVMFDDGSAMLGGFMKVVKKRIGSSQK